MPYGSVLINERSINQGEAYYYVHVEFRLQRECASFSKNLAAELAPTLKPQDRYTRIEITRYPRDLDCHDGTLVQSLIYRRMKNGEMKWVDEDNFMGDTSDDGKSLCGRNA